MSAPRRVLRGLTVLGIASVLTWAAGLIATTLALYSIKILEEEEE